MITSTAALAFNISALAILLFSTHVLILRAKNHHFYLPLSLSLTAIGVVICQPTITAVAPSYRTTLLMLSLPALLIIAPALWLYVQGLTATKPWRFEPSCLKHFIPAGFALLITLSFMSLPKAVTNSLLLEGSLDIVTQQPPWLSNLTHGLLTMTFVLILSWPVQSGLYMLKTVQDLSRYRKQLKDLFSSTDTKEAQWLSWLLLTIGGVWLAAAIYLIIDNLFFAVQLNLIWVNLGLLIFIWSLAIWGLRQKPGFADLYDSTSVLDACDRQKYERSALSDEQSKQIAQKIEKSMADDKIYLDPSLSMQKLSQHIATVPNYISQSLNKTIGANFFDHINKYRIEDAKQLLIESEETVLDIAIKVGFNSRSSFYTAFKKVTGKTPSQYRNSEKQH